MRAGARTWGCASTAICRKRAAMSNIASPNFGKRPVHWMADHDWLGPDVWFAHLVHMDDAGDQARWSETGTGMAHCPQSNCRLGSGIAPAEKIAALGGMVSLAVDGAASNEAADMISEMHSAWHVHRAVKGAGAVVHRGRRALGERRRRARARVRRHRRASRPASSPILRSSISPIRAISACTIHCRGRSQPPARRMCAISWSAAAWLSRTAAIPGLDLTRLRHDAARVVARLAA